MKIVIKILPLILCIIFNSCSTGIVCIEPHLFNNQSYQHQCGSLLDSFSFYKSGGILGDIPLRVDFTKIDVNTKKELINIVGYIKESQTDEVIAGELIIANISYQDSSRIYYDICLKSEIDNSGYFNITTNYNPNNIIITKSTGYYVSYYSISELIKLSNDGKLKNTFALNLWKIDDREIVNPINCDSLKFGNFTAATKPHIESWEIFIPFSDTLRIGVFNKSGVLMGSSYLAKLEKGYYIIKPNDWHLLKKNGVYLLKYTFRSMTSFSKFIYVN